MGQSTSKTVLRNPAKGIVVTLDALGTIYKFREPIGRQYLKVAAQYGLRESIQEASITNAFREAFKKISREYPNYGKDKLPTPEDWWKVLIQETLTRVVEPSKIPSDLGSGLYRHFSTKAAYELFPDVEPFVQSLQVIRQEFSSTEDPALVLGVITNSDPRVQNILQSLSFNVGDVRHAMKPPSMSLEGPMHLPWHDTWNPKRDFDFLLTSYDADAEKPHPQIFNQARPQAALVMLGKSFQGVEESIMNGFRSVSKFADLIQRTKEMQWIHIGDEVVKDYEGAKNFGYDSILLDRDDKHPNHPNRITSLEEAAIAVRLMVQESFQKQT